MAARRLRRIPDIDDIQPELYKILEQYKNYYIDRVN